MTQEMTKDPTVEGSRYLSEFGNSCLQWREKKTDKKKNHIKEFGGRMPRRRPRDKLGTSQGHLGHLGLIYCLHRNDYNLNSWQIEKL